MKGRVNLNFNKPTSSLKLVE